MSGQITLVVVSPRLPAGLMTRAAWAAIEDAELLLGRDSDEPLVETVEESGAVVDVRDSLTPVQVAELLVAEARVGREVTWLGSSDGDPGLTDALAEELTRLETPPPVEVVVGSWDSPGGRLLDAVAVMDTLRSPGGCPWDAQQTHASLAPYLIEESYEVLEAIGEKDAAGLQEELGDVLLQVLFHARVSAERGDDGFDIDDVAGGLVEKLVRRHPHVFADGEAGTAEEVEQEWARIKAIEKPERDAGDPFAGIPAGLPPLERATKMVGRLVKHGHTELLDAAVNHDSIGAALLDLVVQARDLEVDPAVALSSTLAELETSVTRTRQEISDAASQA